MSTNIFLTFKNIKILFTWHFVNAGEMRIFVLIRKFEKSDEIKVNNVVRDYVMSNAKDAFYFCLFKEITLQLIVLISALFFIFFGVPLTLCALTIPSVIIFILFSVYMGYYNKVLNLISEPYRDTWVAELYVPLSVRSSTKDMEYSRIAAIDLQEHPELKRMRKEIAGTMSVRVHQSLDNSGWIFRTAIHPDYNFFMIAEMLLAETIQHCRIERYYSVETATVECHEDAREMFIRNGFNIRQIYTKNYLAGAFKIMKSQLGLQFEEDPYSQNVEDFIRIS